MIRPELDYHPSKPMKYKAIIGVVIGIVLTPIAISLSLKSAGHGDFYWAGVFFPVLTIIMLRGAGAIVVPFVLLQYPLFGWYTGRCISRQNYIRLAVAWVVLQIGPMLVAMFN
jgi:hypothetical protein